VLGEASTLSRLHPIAGAHNKYLSVVCYNNGMDCIKIFSLLASRVARNLRLKKMGRLRKKILRNFLGMFNSRTLVYWRICFKSVVFK